MDGLAGKVAVVTGSSRGIGAATAVALASKGVKVVVNYLGRRDCAEEVVASIVDKGGTAIAVQADVTKESEIGNLFHTTRETYDRLDILVNNAGPLEFALLDDINAEIIDLTVDRNFKSVALCTRKAVSLFPDSGGVVINVSSESVRNILPGSAVFAATKSATEVLIRYLAQELGPRHIRVVGVSPGYTVTPATARLDQDKIDYLVSRTALRRAGDPNDIASVVVFLASDRGAWITGTTLTASGGLDL